MWNIAVTGGRAVHSLWPSNQRCLCFLSVKGISSQSPWPSPPCDHARIHSNAHCRCQACFTHQWTHTFPPPVSTPLPSRRNLLVRSAPLLIPSLLVARPPVTPLAAPHSLLRLPSLFSPFFFLLPPSLTASRTNWEDFQSEQCPFQSIRNMVCKDEDIQSYVGVHVKKKSSTESTQKVRQRKRTTLKRCTLLQDFWTTSKYIFSVFWSGGGGAAGFANTLTRTKWTATQLEFWLAQVYTQNPPPNPLEKYWLIFKNCIQQAWHCAKSSTMSFISWSKAPVLSHTQPLLLREQVFNWLWGFFWNRFWLCGHVWGVRSPSLPDSAVEIARKNQIIWNKFVR